MWELIYFSGIGELTRKLKELIRVITQMDNLIDFFTAYRISSFFFSKPLIKNPFN